MDCATSLAWLSDFHDGALEKVNEVLVGQHLLACPECAEVYHDLAIIVLKAAELRWACSAASPNEPLIWQRVYQASRSFIQA